MPDKALPILQFLPPEIPLDTLAGTVDRVVSSLQQASAAVTTVNIAEISSDQDSHLAQTNSARLDKHHGNPRRRSTSRKRSRHFCWCYDNFGAKANKCEPQCEYNKSLN